MLRLLSIAPLIVVTWISSGSLLADEIIHRGLGPAPDSLDLHRGQSLAALNVLRDLHEGLVTVAADGGVFVNFPRWAENVPFTVSKIVDGEPQRFPNREMNQYDSLDDSEHFISVQSVVVGPAGRLWALDTGRPQFQFAEPVRLGGR